MAEIPDGMSLADWLILQPEEPAATIPVQCDMCNLDFEISQGSTGPWLTLCDDCSYEAEIAAERTGE